VRGILYGVLLFRPLVHTSILSFCVFVTFRRTLCENLAVRFVDIPVALDELPALRCVQTGANLGEKLLAIISLFVRQPRVPFW